MSPQTVPAPLDPVHLLHLSHAQEVKDLEHLRFTSRTIRSLRGLIHALQRERGASSLMLVLGQPEDRLRLESAHDETRRELATAQQALADWLESLAGSSASSRLYSELALMSHGLRQICSLRHCVLMAEIPLMEAFARYNGLIRHLLAVAFESAGTGSHPSISSALVALLNFMQGKELAGQERAVGVAGFSGRWTDPELRTALVNRIDAQEHCFEIFSEFAPPDSLQAWQMLQAGPVNLGLERARRLALSGTSPSRAGDSGLMAAVWFEQATLRMDALKLIEDELEVYLLAVCEDELGRAKARRVGDLSEVDWTAGTARSSESAAALPQGVLHGRSVEGDAGLSLADTLQMGAGQPGTRLGRTLLDLLHHQSQRLHSMEDELQRARHALEERAVIEQAKALLIKRRGLSEEEAYRALRRLAMDQGKRLAEVAAATVGMADLLGDRF